MGRTDALAHELKLIIRLADRKSEQLAGLMPTFSEFRQVTDAGELPDAERIHFILYTLIPDFVERMPTGPDGMAIRELLRWRDDHGQSPSLTTRYHKAGRHLRVHGDHFEKRQEPRLLGVCAQWFSEFDLHDRGRGSRSPGEDAASSLAPADPCVGLTRLHRRLDSRTLVENMRGARVIAILNTWIPDLNTYAHALLEALEDGARVEILMLHPESSAAALRSAALPGSSKARFHENHVRLGVRQCLATLATIADALGDDGRGRLRVGLYDSLPSLAIYSIDGRATVSVFLHGRLAVDGPQMEIAGADTLLGATVFNELQTLWGIAAQFTDIRDWEAEMAEMAPGHAGPSWR